MPRRIIDLRPAGAFVKGTFPGAASLPLESRAAFPYVLEQLKTLGETAPVHIIDSDGAQSEILSKELPLFVLDGGYRAFKKWRDTVFSAGPPLILLGGKTGSGKTETLQLLKTMDCQVLDLEELARHKGSVFGAFSDIQQPSHEDFHNMLLERWLSFDPGRPVWIEEKNHVLGTVGIPHLLYQKMCTAFLVELEVLFEQRLDHILLEYKPQDAESFAASIRKLESRMGMRQTHKALHYHATGQTEKCFRLLLSYYDNAYEQRRKEWHQGKMHRMCPDDFKDVQGIRALEKPVMVPYKRENPAD